MIKIKALNEVVNIDSNEEYNNALTKEAQEQVALNEYNRALQLLIENNKEEALVVLKELINTELLNIVRKPKFGDGSSRPMLSLKYSCYKNIGSIEADFKRYHAAIYNYWEAANLDDSDVMLWYKIGLIAIEIANLEVASLAFTQGLKRNKYHWPCLDHIITVLYAIPDHVNCLYYISMALEQDPTYIKGLAFCKDILKSIPELKNFIISSKNEWMIELLNVEYDTAIADSLIKKAVKLQQKWIETSQEEILNISLHDLKLRRSLEQLSWLELGKSLIDMYNYIFDNKFNFMCHILFDGFDHLNQQYLNDVNKHNSSKVDVSTMSTNTVCLSTNYNKINFYNCLDSPSDLLPSSTKPSEEEKAFSYEVQSIEEDLQSKYFEINYSNSQDLEEDNSIHTNENSKINVDQDKTESSVNESGKSNAELIEPSFENKKISTKPFENSEISTKFDIKDKAQKVKKRRRSSLCFLTQWAWSSSNTKRSSRARNIGRKEYEKDGLVEDTLRRIFPPSFMAENNSLSKEEVPKNDDSLDTMDLYYMAEDKDNNLVDDIKSAGNFIPTNPIQDDTLRYFGSKDETFDVCNFMKEFNGSKNIIILIAEFTRFLCTKWNHEWSDELIELFIQSYLKTRNHLPHLSLINQNVKDNLKKLDAEKTLLFCELYTDKWSLKKFSTLPLIGLQTLGIGLSSEELGHLIFYSSQNEWCNENIIFFLRLLWLQAKIFFYQGQADTSIRTLELLLHNMQQFHYDSKKLVIKLRNCKNNSLLSAKTVQNLLKFIQRSKKVREIKYLYQEKKYEELTIILKESLSMPKTINPCLHYGETPINRNEHMCILLDSFWQLKQYEECYVWSETCFNESWNNYLNNINSTKNHEEGNKWVQTILYSLDKLNACIVEASIFIAKHLSETRLLRLVQNLINLVCHQLEVPDHTTVMTIESVLPWLLLHFILQYVEDKHRAKTEKAMKYPPLMNSESDDEEEDIPSSITILLKAHEFLGRHAWCCINEGRLLIFIMKLLIPQFRSPLYSTIKDKLKEPLEQAIYCLYGHPDKNLNASKLKVKNYDEHVKSHSRLTWESSELLFEFYRPEILPNIESKRVDSINADVVCLFKQICKLIPEESDPNQIIDQLNEYLVGKKAVCPSIKKPLNNQISYIYYLIADHYFKTGPNQSWKKAINYYKFDLCLHPCELNSWAGLAMSTSTLMETWLNNFQPNINEEKYLKEAKIAQRSYEKAVDLAPSHLTIRTEFGNFLYTVHSFCSRLLKQESDSLSMERFRIIENHKEEMLEEAEKCFTSANHIYIACQGIDEPQDERWLYHYMLAKILEKKNYEPPIFLSHYSKANQLLNENHAEYPKRISHKSPQNLAVEALEIYYRIHASILKYLEHHEGETIKRSLATVFMENLQVCSKGPFMTQNMALSTNFKINESNTNVDNLARDIQFQNKQCHKSLIQNSNSTKTLFCNENNKFESRKRGSELQSYASAKKIKTNNISHLELMQDVLQLTNDLITEVCINVSSDQYQFDNDDHQYNVSNKVSFYNINTLRNNTSSYTKVKECESQEYQAHPDIEDETLKKCLSKTAQNEDSEMENYFVSKVFDGFQDIDNPPRNTSRRGSQESTTTSHTSTTGNNSSTSTSDDSSSSDDTSCSSSTTNTDSDSNISDPDKKNIVLNEDSSISSEEMTKLIENCLSGLEQCILRFPEHYKSIYRLAHFFFYNESHKDLNKCRQLLLGTYECQFHRNQTIQGLFFDRKNNNFFNGIWRIPSNEIDRPGSFASHMSRCILLLMQVLKETGDSSMLIELCLQLRKTPDSDKKYLGDSERKQLSSQALTLCLQCLRNRIKMDESIEIFDSYKSRMKQVLLDIFHAYQNIKNLPEYETSELPKIRKLLEDAYLSYNSNFGIQGNMFEMAIEYCRQIIRGYKTKVVGNDINTNTRIIEASINQMPLSNTGKSLVTNLQTNSQRKSQKSIGSARPRGRPPSSSKFLQTISNTHMTQNPNDSNQLITHDLYSSRSSNLSNNPLFNSLFDQEALSVMIRSGVHTNVLEYLNQVGTYQNAIRQYQNNLNLNSNIESNNYKKEMKQCLPHQNLCNYNIVENCLSSVKERKDLSITPVALSKSNIKPKSFDLLSNHEASSNSSPSVSVSKSVHKSQISSFSQVPSQTPQSSLAPIRDISKPYSINSLLLDNIPRAHCSTNTIKDQFAISSAEIHRYRSIQNISLQHKLLSKKQPQQLYESSQEFESLKKHKPHQLITNNSSSKNSSISPFVNTLSESRNYLHSSNTKKSSSFTQKSNQSNISVSPLLSKAIQNTNNPFSVISQLQQQSHLEIIPQTRSESENMFRRAMAEQNQSEISSFVKKDSTQIFELPKPRVTVPFAGGVKNKKQDDSKNEKVEVITLDD